MTLDVSFYHVMRLTLEHALAQILERTYSRGQRTAVQVADEAQVQALDTALWTYEPGSFLPHASSRNQHADLQPILIGTGGPWANKPEVLIAVAVPLPETLEGYTRVAYVFDGREEAQLQAARQAWSALKDSGYTRAYYQQRETGGWEKKA